MDTLNYTSSEQVKEAIFNNYKSLEDIVNNLVSKTDFRVGETCAGSNSITIELIIYTDLEKEETVRWNSLKLSLEDDVFKTGKGRQFKTNIGTTGEFSLEDTSKSSRANFYIQVGKILGDSELLGCIKNALIVHAAAIRELRKQWKEIQLEEV